MPIQSSIAQSTQPETASQLILRSLKLYRAAFTKVFYLSLILSICAFIPRIFALAIGENIFVVLPHFSYYRLWLIVVDVLCLVFFSAILWRMYNVFMNARETIVDDVKMALKKLPYILVAVIVLWLMFVLINLSFFGVYSYFKQENVLSISDPSIMWAMSLVVLSHLVLLVYLTTLFLFYLPLILIENKGVLRAIERSASLVWGRWWRTFLLQATPWLLYLICLSLIRIVAQVNIHIYFVAPDAQSVFGTALNLIIFTFFVPWSAALLLVQLRDLELRKKITAKPVASL